MNDDDFPQTIGGIVYKSKEEYDNRVKADAHAMAQLLYDIYRDKKLKEQGKDVLPLED